MYHFRKVEIVWSTYKRKPPIQKFGDGSDLWAGTTEERPRGRALTSYSVPQQNNGCQGNSTFFHVALYQFQLSSYPNCKQLVMARDYTYRVFHTTLLHPWRGVTLARTEL